MVTTNFQTYGTKGFNLRFRMYQNGEVRYITVNNILQGNLLSRHWNQKKQLFIPSAPFSNENNNALVQFKTKYDEALLHWEGDLMSFSITARKGELQQVTNQTMYLKNALEWVVERAKESRHSDGTITGTYENYVKVIKRLGEYCDDRKKKFETIKLEDVDSYFVNDVIAWILLNKGGNGIDFSKMFRAALNKISGAGWYDFSRVENCNWQKKSKASAKKYYTLSEQKCAFFVGLNHKQLPKGNGHYPLLYRDVCVFILYTCQSICDALSMKYSNIKKIDGVEYLVFKRRKIEHKQTVECSVPINKEMKTIMKRWKHLSKKDYIFPVRGKDKVSKTNNGEIKKFLSRLNVWLKKLGTMLKCDFPVSSYTFRHTAITRYVSMGIPTVYIANLAGTSVDNIEKIYYNNRGDIATTTRVLSAIKFDK